MFSHPWWLLLLLVVVGLAVGYVLLLRRRRRDTMRFTNLELLDRVAPERQGWYRHVPAVAMIVALAVLTIALAGPQAEARVPRNRATVVLVIDVSLSMQATDVEPNRLAAAQAAAKSFAEELTPGINLGLVSFAGTAAVLVSPTVEREPVIRAIDGQLLGVRGERPENVTYPGAAEPLQRVWIALRANERAVLESVTLADIVSGELPPAVAVLTDSPQAWV